MTGETSTGLSPRAAGLLAYSGWWVTGLLFLLLERDDRSVRFHAAQAVVVFGAISLVLIGAALASFAALFVSAPAFQTARWVANLLWLASIALWLILMAQTARGEIFRVPLAAPLADRLAGLRT